MQKIYLNSQRKEHVSHHSDKRFIFALLLMLAAAMPFVATAASTLQGVAISGKVTDDTGAALPGVNVIEKGTNNGTVSDADGSYRLTVASPSSIVIFSFVGTVSQEILVGSQTDISPSMASDASTLSEVVIIGYGSQEKKDITGAVGSVSSENFNRGIINSPEQLLQGKVAGVNVTSASGEPGGAQAIVIRGPGGVRTGNTPLFVVDGMILDNSSTGGSANPLNFINPQDIETFDVLKDASATAVYGSRGANGVVIITTRKGKAGVSTITYSLNYGISKMARPIDVFSADEYRIRVPEAGGILEDSLANTDWQKEVTRSAITKTHSLTLRGGADKLTYFASFGLQDQEGVLKNSNMKRYTGRFNVTQKFLNDKLNVDLNMTATQTMNERPNIESVIGSALSVNPTYPAYDAAGKPYRGPSGTNPLLTLDLYNNYTKTNRVLGNIAPSLEIIKGLVYKLNLGIDYSQAIQEVETIPSLVPQQDGRLEDYYTYNTNSLVENTLTYQMDKGDHSLNILAGQSYQRVFLQGQSWSINKFPVSEISPRYNPGRGQDLTLTNNKPGGYAVENEIQSFFGRAIYQWKGKYHATGTVRADGSSKFGENNKYGVFSSFSLGWTISDEAFMSDLPVTLKLRGGWGQTGNQEIPPKITKAAFDSQVAASNTYPLEDTYPAGTVYSRLANPNIQWEVSTQTNIGVDFEFLSGALSGSIDYFNKVTNDILLRIQPADPVQPGGDYWSNINDMKIKNNGLELSLNYQHRSASGLTFNVGGNATFIHNNVTGSPYTVLPSGSASGSGLTSATINGYINGEPIGTFFLKEFTGIDEDGLSTYRDTDGDGIITDKDRVAAGSALPTTLYNFNASVSWKGFDFAINFNGVSGNKIYDNTANTNFYKARLAKGLNTTTAATEFPNESPDNAAPVSTRFLKNGAFLRLNNMSLGYNLKPSLIGLDRWVTGVRVSVTGQNLFVITDYDGYDPEVSTDRQIDGALSYGIDYMSYPKAKSVMFGLNVTF